MFENVTIQFGDIDQDSPEHAAEAVVKIIRDREISTVFVTVDGKDYEVEIR